MNTLHLILPPPPWEDSCIKKIVVLVENFEKKIPKMYQDPVLWAWLESFFSLRGSSSQTSSHPPLRNLINLLPDSSTSIVSRTRAIVSVVYIIAFSGNPVKPYERCVVPLKQHIYLLSYFSALLCHSIL